MREAYRYNGTAAFLKVIPIAAFLKYKEQAPWVVGAMPLARAHRLLKVL